MKKLILIFCCILTAAVLVSKEAAVATALKDIAAGQKLKASDFTAVPEKAAFLTNKFTVTAVKAGQPIRESYLLDFAPPVISYKQYALPVDEPLARAFLSGRWDFNATVDIMAAKEMRKNGDSLPRLMTFTILQNVRAPRILESEGKYALVLELSETDGQYLFLMEKEADIKIILRTEKDRMITAWPITQERGLGNVN